MLLFYLAVLALLVMRECPIIHILGIPVDCGGREPLKQSVDTDLSSAVSFHYRAQLPLPNRLRSLFPALNHYAPISTFADQAEAGLSSGNFDIEAANILAGDSRTGLDERETHEVLDIMRRERVK